VAEWTNAAALKAAGRKARGFESLPFRWCLRGTFTAASVAILPSARCGEFHSGECERRGHDRGAGDDMRGGPSEHPIGCGRAVSIRHRLGEILIQLRRLRSKPDQNERDDADADGLDRTVRQVHPIWMIRSRAPA
jgi:hypothetical protein